MITEEEEVKKQADKAIEALRESGERIEMKLIFQLFKEEVELPDGSKTDKIGGLQWGRPKCFEGIVSDKALSHIMAEIAKKALNFALGE